MSRWSIALVLVAWAGLVMADPLELTWTHDCKDVDGNDEVMGLWEVVVKKADESVITTQTLDDAECALREWTLEEFDLEGERQFGVELRAVDAAGNKSEPAVVSWTATDTTPPSGGNIINLEFTCPAGRTCNVIINGEQQ